LLSDQLQVLEELSRPLVVLIWQPNEDLSLQTEHSKLNLGIIDKNYIDVNYSREFFLKLKRCVHVALVALTTIYQRMCD
jgi:hypothetical protein